MVGMVPMVDVMVGMIFLFRGMTPTKIEPCPNGILIKDSRIRYRIYSFLNKATNVKFDEKNSEPKKDLRNKAHDVLFRIISTGARWATGLPLFFCMFFLRQAWYTFKRRWNSTRQASSNSKSANKDVLLKNWQATLKKTEDENKLLQILRYELRKSDVFWSIHFNTCLPHNVCGL